MLLQAQDDATLRSLEHVFRDTGGGNPCVVAWLSKPRRPMNVQVIWMAISPILEAIEEGRLTSVSYCGQLPRRQLASCQFASKYGENIQTWRSGRNAANFKKWTSYSFRLTPSSLRIVINGKEIANLDISAIPAKNGGVYFYPYGSAKIQIRNARIREAKQVSALCTARPIACSLVVARHLR